MGLAQKPVPQIAGCLFHGIFSFTFSFNMLYIKYYHTLLDSLGELYPDYVISREMGQEYRDVFRHVTRVSALLGYESWEAFLTASGFVLFLSICCILNIIIHF